MSTEFYAGEPGEPPARNILTGIAAVESPNTTWEFNLEKAAQTLEAAGWVMDGDVRKKDGMELKLTYATTINAVRQGNQAVNKQNWESIGFEVELRQVDAGVFFDSSAGNDQNAQHFYYDMQMYADNPSLVFPLNYMQNWYGGPNPNMPDGSNISQRENSWQGNNSSRFQNAEYDALFEAARAEVDAEKAAELYIQMNDILINEAPSFPWCSARRTNTRSPSCSTTTTLRRVSSRSCTGTSPTGTSRRRRSLSNNATAKARPGMRPVSLSVQKVFNSLHGKWR